MPKQSVVEILVFKPNPTIPEEQRGVHENLWLKQSAKQYLSIGVYLEGADLRYYFFKEAGNNPKIYYSLNALKQDLPVEIKTIFENEPELFVMGHGRGGSYGLCNIHGASEEINGSSFDGIIVDFKAALVNSHRDVVVTLEGCNTDDWLSALKEGETKSFLQRLSMNHPLITFCGTGPWDANDVQTGFRASGGFPVLNVPVTAMHGNAWKHPNSETVVFYHDGFQMLAKRTSLASIDTAKALKINTAKYAQAVLEKAALSEGMIADLMEKICLSRDILKIKDLRNLPEFPQHTVVCEEETQLIVAQNKILVFEKINYLANTQKILLNAKSGGELTERDVLTIALGLKNPVIFNGHEPLLYEIFSNTQLLQLVMVACGKVLIGGSNNNDLIDILLRKGIDINCVDKDGMTALHHTCQDFFNYRKEPIALVRKLVDCGAKLDLQDKKSKTPLAILKERAQDPRVSAMHDVEKLVEERLVALAVASPEAEDSTPYANNRSYPRFMHHTHASFFRVLEKQKSSFPTPPSGMSQKVP